MVLCKLERRSYGGKWPVSIKYQNFHSYKEAGRVDSLMSEYHWKEKNNTFTWLSSLYNPFKDILISFVACFTKIKIHSKILSNLGGHLKNILFALPGRLFFWTKETLQFGLENWKILILQFLETSEFCQWRKL